MFFLDKTNVNDGLYGIFLFFLLLNKIGYHGDSKKNILNSNIF